MQIRQGKNILHKYTKFITADTSDEVTAAKNLLHNLYNMQKDLVTNQMAEGIIDAFEFINVDNEQTDILILMHCLKLSTYMCPECRFIHDIRKLLNFRTALQLSVFL